jgi:hypothetical protein
MKFDSSIRAAIVLRPRAEVSVVARAATQTLFGKRSSFFVDSNGNSLWKYWLALTLIEMFSKTTFVARVSLTDKHTMVMFVSLASPKVLCGSFRQLIS